MSSRAIRLRIRLRPVRLAASSVADDALAIAGAACIAVASGFVAPAGPWLVAGVFLLASATSSKRKGA